MLSWNVEDTSIIVGESDGSDGLVAGTRFLEADGNWAELITESHFLFGSFTLSWKMFAASPAGGGSLTFLMKNRDGSSNPADSQNLAVGLHATSLRMLCRKRLNGAQSFPSIVADAFSLDEWTDVKVTRASDGTYSIYTNNNLLDTVVDTDIVTPNFIHLSLNGHGTKVADLKITRGVE